MYLKNWTLYLTGIQTGSTSTFAIKSEVSEDYFIANKLDNIYHISVPV